MIIENLLAVLGWCMVVNFAIMFIWLIATKAAPDLVYRTQGMVTAMSREEFDRVIYKLMGQFKLGIILFNFAPYVAIRIVYT